MEVFNPSGYYWRAPGNTGSVWDLMHSDACVGQVFSIGDNEYEYHSSLIVYQRKTFNSMKMAATDLIGKIFNIRAIS